VIIAVIATPTNNFPGDSTPESALAKKACFGDQSIPGTIREVKGKSEDWLAEGVGFEPTRPFRA
jgi:hypothetical protein